MYIFWDQKDEEITKGFKNGYKSSMLETEVAFDAADMMRCGKDIFYKKDSSANNLGIEWLRREFPGISLILIVLLINSFIRAKVSYDAFSRRWNTTHGC